MSVGLVHVSNQDGAMSELCLLALNLLFKPHDQDVLLVQLDSQVRSLLIKRADNLSVFLVLSFSLAEPFLESQGGGVRHSSGC